MIHDDLEATFDDAGAPRESPGFVIFDDDDSLSDIAEHNALNASDAAEPSGTNDSSPAYDFEPQENDAAPIFATRQMGQRSAHRAPARKIPVVDWLLAHMHRLRHGYARVEDGHSSTHVSPDEIYELGDIDEERARSAPTSSRTPGSLYGGGQGNDGVFSNLVARPSQRRDRRTFTSAFLNTVTFGALGEPKPYQATPHGIEYVGGNDEDGDKDNTPPPSYETAAQDAVPPYWDSAVLVSPTRGTFDEIVVDDLPVGSFFGFAWSFLITMIFQFVGFLLTYLLHTTHAAKNGSRVGLGVTLIQMGLFIKNPTHHALDINAPPFDPNDSSTIDDDTPPPDTPPSANLFSGSDADSDPQQHAPSIAETLFGQLQPPDGAPDAASDAAVDATSSASASAATATVSAGAAALAARSADSLLSWGSKFSLPPGYSGNDTAVEMDLEEQDSMIRAAYSSWLGIFFMVLGWILIIGSLISYYRVICLARSIQRHARNNGAPPPPEDDPPEAPTDRFVRALGIDPSRLTVFARPVAE